VTVLDNWGNGGRDFTRTIPFDKLTAVMSKTKVDEARQAGRVLGEQPIGFILAPKPTEVPSQAVQPVQEPPEVCESTVIRSGIETPRGPLTRKATALQDHCNPQKSPKQGMGL